MFSKKLSVHIISFIINVTKRDLLKLCSELFLAIVVSVLATFMFNISFTTFFTEKQERWCQLALRKCFIWTLIFVGIKSFTSYKFLTFILQVSRPIFLLYWLSIWILDFFFSPIFFLKVNIFFIPFFILVGGWHSWQSSFRFYNFLHISDFAFYLFHILIVCLILNV